MAPLKIKKYPDAVLRKRCASLEGKCAGKEVLFSDMAETMHATGGIGLAASQVGISDRIAIVDSDEGLLKMINPEILARKGSSALEEGCLSVPEAAVTVRRAEEVSVSYVDEKGRHIKKTFRGLTARVVQHEIDHLNGKLIIDYLPWYKRLFRKG